MTDHANELRRQGRLEGVARSSTGGQVMKHGCCEDKACTAETCMQLPEGKTCGNCMHERRCCSMFGHTPTDTYCDWFPRRFSEKLKAPEAKS